MVFVVRFYASFFILSTNSEEFFKHGAQRLKAHSWTQGWRWANHMLQEKSLVEVDACISDKDSHLSHSSHYLPLHWPPVTCSESPGSSPLLPACSLSVCTSASLSLPFSLSLLLSPRGAHQHTKSRLTVSLPRQSKKTEESIFRYRLLLLTGERPQR